MDGISFYCSIGDIKNPIAGIKRDGSCIRAWFLFVSVAFMWIDLEKLIIGMLKCVRKS